MALTQATLPYLFQLADKGWQKACRENLELTKGLNIADGSVMNKAVANAFDLTYQTYSNQNSDLLNLN